MKIFLPSLCAVALLSACASTNAPDPLGGLVDEVTALSENGVQAITAAQLPETATMSGYLAAAETDGTPDTLIVGNASATADFGAGTLTGTANNFTEYELSAACDTTFEGCTGTAQQTLGGSLDLAGTIRGTDFTYSTTGTFTGTNDQIGAYTSDVTGNGVGTFAHDGNGTLLAVGEGSAIADVTVGDVDAGNIEFDTFLLLTE